LQFIQNFGHDQTAEILNLLGLLFHVNVVELVDQLGKGTDIDLLYIIIDGFHQRLDHFVLSSSGAHSISQKGLQYLQPFSWRKSFQMIVLLENIFDNLLGVWHAEIFRGLLQNPYN
jgi:hypothetical protein